MPITGRFEADFSSFKAAVDQATVQLNGFQSNAGRVEASLTKMANSLSGTAMIQQATLMASAVDKIGGISSLTAGELQKLGAQAAEAIAKMKATEITEIPKNLQDIADAADKAKRATSGLFDGIGEELAGLVGGALSVGAIVAFGRGVIETGADIEKMAEQTSLGTDRIQELSYIAGQTHVSIDTLISGVQNLQQRLGDDNTGAAAALKRLGINLQAFSQLDAFEQLQQISDALRNVKDPTVQATDAAALFGKTWKEIVPALKSDFEGLAAAAPKMSEATVRSLDQAERNFNTFFTTVKVGAANFYNALVDETAKAISRLDPRNLGLTPDQWAAIYGAQNDPTGQKGAYAKIPGVSLPTAANPSAPSLTKQALSDLNDQFQVQYDAAHKAAEALKSWQDVATDINALMKGPDGLDGTTEEAVKYFLALGASQSQLATYFGVSQGSIKAVADSMAAAKEQARQLTEAAKELARQFPIAQVAAGALPNLLPNSSGNLNLSSSGAFNGGTTPLVDIKLQDVAKHSEAAAEAQKKVADASKQVDEKTQEWTKSLSDASQALSQLATVAGGSFGGIVRDLAEVVTATNAVAAGVKSFDTAGGGLAGIVSKVSGITSIVAGGISILGSIGKALNIGGPDQAELDTRKARQKAGLTNDNAIQADEDALTQLGASAAQAQQLVGRALDAKTPQAFAAAMKPVNDALALQSRLNADVNSVTALIGAFQNAGHVLPQSMVATLQALAKMPGLTADEQKALQNLIDAAKPNFESLESTAEKYGATLQGLGPKIAQGQLDDTAKGIYKDFEDLTNAGAEAGNVIGAMHDKIQDLVQQAITSGSSLPKFLEPLIDNLAGNLKDTKGNLIDVTQIKFDNTPTDDGLAEMQSSLDDLQDTLKNGVPNALNDLLKQIPSNPFAGWNIPNLPAPSEGSPATAETGGVVVPFGIRRFGSGGIVPGGPSGTDTVPAWLTPGEMILNASQQRALFSDRGGDHVTTVIVEMDGQEIANNTTRHQSRALRIKTKLRAA